MYNILYTSNKMNENQCRDLTTIPNGKKQGIVYIVYRH